MEEETVDVAHVEMAEKELDRKPYADGLVVVWIEDFANYLRGESA